MVKENEVYEQLAEMIDEEDIVGIQKTPALLKVLSLQFTPEEARLALHVHLAGAKLDEIAERSGIKKEKLKKLLNTMADKGTMFIEPGKEDPTYKVVGASAPGLTETGLWGNIKYPYTVELAKALHQVLKEWSEEKLCKLGFPFTPVWAGTLALPDDVQLSENLAEVIRDAGHWSVSVCPCRLSHWLVDPGNHCEHILETCIHTGDLSRWAVEHGMARELSYGEVVELLRECNRDGLVHTLDINSVICNCCDDCCAIFHGYKLGAPTFIPSPDAIEVDDFASVNQDICLGCGVCVPTCKTKSMKLVRRPQSE